MQVRSTIVAGVIAAVAAAGAFTLETVAPAHAVGRSSGPRPLFREGILPAERVKSITLRRGDAPEMRFERRDTGWIQLEPFEFPMDAYSMEQLARIAAQAVTVQELDPASLDGALGPSTLGLEPAEGSLRLEWPGGSVTLALGRRGVGGRAYLQVEGIDTIYVVNHDLHDRALDMDTKEWRSRRLFQGAGIDSDRIEYSTGDGDQKRTVTLVREDRTWRMTAPVSSRVDEVALEGLVSALGRASASGFVLDEPDGLDRFGLEPSAGSFSVTTRVTAADGSATARTQTLVVGSRIGVGSEDRFAMVAGRPVVMRLPGAAIGSLFPAPLQLVSPLACGVSPSAVKAIRISASSEELVLERDVERWIMPDADGAAVDPARVRTLLEALTTVRATGIDIAPFPREQPHVLLTLVGYDRRPLDSVRILPPGPDGDWVIENGDGVLRSYPGSMDLPLSLEGLLPASG